MRRSLRPSRVVWVTWATVGALTLGCEASRTLDVLEGESPGLGGATQDDAATGGKTGDPPPDSTGGAMGRVTPDTLIDDFYDCNGLIITTAGRSGSWYHFAEPAVNLVRVKYNYGPAPDQSWATQQCGIYLSGACDDCISAGVGFQLAPEAWDLSDYSGIRVWIESETSIWAVVVTSDGSQSGYSEYVELLPTGNVSAERILSFDEILPGTGFLGLARAREVQFTVGEGDRGSFRFGIHRVELVE